MSKTWFYRRAFKKQRTEERSLSDDTGQIDIHGATCVVETRGAGRDILYLSSGMWFADESAFIGKLAELGRVTAPVAPGFCPGAVDARMNNVDDIAYLWLDLIDELKLKDVLLVGASFGGWVAAEMAVKSCKSIAGVALIDPVGIKVGDRYARDIADLYGLPEREILRRAYVDPSVFASDVKSISDAELARRARARESIARYGWSPFLHDPKLAGRLRRVTAPTLVLWGAKDGVASPDYGRAYAARVKGATFAEIAGAGHFPQVEKPGETLAALASFSGAHRAAAY